MPVRVGPAGQQWGARRCAGLLQDVWPAFVGGLLAALLFPAAIALPIAGLRITGGVSHHYLPRAVELCAIHGAVGGLLLSSLRLDWRRGGLLVGFGSLAVLSMQQIWRSTTRCPTSGRASASTC